MISTAAKTWMAFEAVSCNWRLVLPFIGAFMRIEPPSPKTKTDKLL
ncbi:hypothetical protein [uncultured Polaribacter sp.]|nr:hypothetical protein [uncultured Polaribacter sp.]